MSLPGFSQCWCGVVCDADVDDVDVDDGGAGGLEQEKFFTFFSYSNLAVCFGCIQLPNTHHPIIPLPLRQ